jgi:hypothetical protein
MSAGKCPMGQSLGVSRGTALSVGRLGQLGQTEHVGQISTGSWPRCTGPELTEL